MIAFSVAFTTRTCFILNLMKYSFLFLLFLIPIFSYSQFVLGEQLPIDLDIQSARIARSGDIDGDGDIDVVSSSFQGLTWYENIDGLGTFSTPNVISPPLGQVFGTTVSDLDGDGDLDLTATSFDEDEVYWFENLDGQGTFSTPRLISDQFLGPIDIITVDLDGDLDLDVIINSDVDDVLSWFENLDGLGNFGSQQIITTSFTNGRSVVAGDIDDDGDLDLVSSNSGSSTIIWFENLNGQGNFNTGFIIAGAAPGVAEISLADLDGDNDLDVVSATNSLDRVSWHENLDGLGNFGSQQVISNDIEVVLSIDIVDVDNDGDQDVIAVGADFSDGGLIWFENLDGQGNFNIGTFIDQPTPSARSVHATDIDGDGDMDVIVPILADDVLVWYENQTVLSVEEVQLGDIQIYPNPVKDILYFEIPQELVVNTIILYDVLGRKVMTVLNSLTSMDMRSLQKGVYFVSIFSQDKTFTKKIVLN